MQEFWKIALGVAGLGGVASFVFWSLYKRWLSLPIFQTLTQEQLYQLFRLFLILTFLFAVIGLATYGIMTYVTIPPGARQPNGISIGGNVNSGGDTVLVSETSGGQVIIQSGISKSEIDSALDRYSKELAKSSSHTANLEGKIAARKELLDRFVKEMASEHRIDYEGLQTAKTKLENQLGRVASEVPYKVLHNDVKDTIRAAREIAELLQEHGNYNESLANLKLAALLDPLNSESWNSLGVCFRERGELLDSIKSFLNAIALSKDDDKKIKYQCSLATVYQRLDLLEQAEALMLNGINFFEKKKDLDSLAVVYGNLGTVEAQLGHFDKAVDYLGKTIPIYKSKHEFNMLNSTYFNLSIMYLGKAMIIDAKKYKELYEDGVKLAGREFEERGNALFLTAQILVEEGKIIEAAKTFEHGGSVMSSQGQLFHAAIAYRNAGDSYARAKDHISAKRCLDKALELSQASKNTEIKATVEALLKNLPDEKN